MHRAAVRSLKIQPKVRDNRWSRTISSEIRLCGKWLKELGFHHGKRVSVTTMRGELIIRVEAG